MIQNQKSPQDLGFELANLLLCATVRLSNYGDDVHLNNQGDQCVIMMLFTILWILRMNSTSRGFSPCPVGAMKYKQACTLLSGTCESKGHEHKFFRTFFADLHPGDPGLGLEEVVELILDVLKDRRPAVGVVDCIAVPSGLPLTG